MFKEDIELAKKARLNARITQSGKVDTSGYM